jgi:hypothetical protein
MDLERIRVRMDEIKERMDFVRSHIRQQTGELNLLGPEDLVRQFQLEMKIADYYEELVAGSLKYRRMQKRLTAV